MARLDEMIADRMRDAIVRTYGAEHADVDPLVRPTQDPRFGDFQANVAMSLAKRLGKKPRDVADALVAALDVTGLAATPTIAGPGFVNLRIDEPLIGRLAGHAAADARLGLATTGEPIAVAVDYSGPNVAKDMHVGHLRSTVIGDAIARTLAFQGDRVTRQNHVGDWGTQFGMLIEYLVEQGRDLDDDTLDLTACYREASARDAADPAFADRARRRVVALQSGDPESRRIWAHLVALSARRFQMVYDQLDVALGPADIRGESFYNDRLAAVVADLRAAGLARESEGALCVFPEGFKTKDGAPLPLIVQKGDGGYLYATTDLAALRYRVGELGARRLVYVTDARQRQHFQMVFATARAAGWAPADVALEHVPFGSVLGEDGKPFKTRAGETVGLAALLDEAEVRARAIVAEKNADLDPAEQARVAHAVGIGAIKYADLASDRVKDYVFNWDRMLAMEGNTAPYLQYAYTRIRSIFRKAGIEHAAAAPILFFEPPERTLALTILAFEGVVDAVGRTLEPHRLCGYLYDLAVAFSAFYEACPVLSAEPPLRAGRLVLADLTGRTLAQGLELLGIRVVERM
jgi:arginyl-tRNA synthetase